MKRERLKEFAESGFQDTIVEYMDSVIARHNAPASIPTDSLEDVKAHKRVLEYLHEMREFFRTLTPDEHEVHGEYE